jgi:uncharacterized SAM-binding protein YcdF (DUF218 family)
VSATASSKRKVRLFWTFLPFIVIGLTFAFVAHAIVRDSRQQQLHLADAIVVFGAAQYDGRPSPVFKARLDHANALFRQGLAPVIITTGGAASDPKFSEGGVGHDYLMRKGVPEAALIAETTASDTSQSAQRVAVIMRANHMQSCVAVSDAYHVFRIREMLEHEGLRVYLAPRADSRPKSAWQRTLAILRESASYLVWKLGIRN